MKLNIPTEPQTESKGPAMKTRVIVHRSLLRGTFYILAALSLIAYLLPARAEAGVRVVAQVGPVAVDYRDRGPGYDARAAVYLEPVAARVLVGRPACGPDRPGCLVRVVDRCDRHDRNRDGRCDKCERRDRRERRDTAATAVTGVPRRPPRLRRPRWARWDQQPWRSLRTFRPLQ
jgi:hypothetical protein